MTCRYCASELPDGALFCGECGRAVVVESLVGANVLAGALEASGDAAGETTGEKIAEVYARFAPPTPESDSRVRCPQCESVVEDSDVFCGECGFVLRAAIPGPRDTGAVDLVETPWPFSADSASAAEPEPEPEPELAPESDSQHRKDPNMETENQNDELATAGRLRTIPDPFPWGAADLDDDAEDIEATRIVSANGGDRFVLQFSTGESVTVAGAGLIGRNPAAQPGEYVDQLVSIFDVGKSVSKTHLEFGQEGGRFWVSDRYSTNGSVVR
ncbi:MAG: zinc ribbon domain-containing protein, partial [Pseudolysinimonas sp.]